MLIAQLCLASNERGGDWFYRVQGPGRALSDTEGVWSVDAPHIHRHRTRLIDQADVLVINMVPDVDLRPAIAARRRRGQVTVFEMNDDVAHLHPANPYAVFYADPYEVTKLKQLLATCDAVQFSTEELQRIYGRYARRSAVFMNQMPARRHPPRRRGKNLVVGWGGSAGHLPDLAWAAPALCHWINQRHDVELHIMADPRLFDLFQSLPAAKKRHVPVGDINAYYDFVAGIDIGIAPLQDTGFNRSRSDVKFLEFALHGAVPVVQDLAPYRATVRDSKTGVLFGDPDSLIAALDHLAASPETRAAIADNAGAYVERERNQAAAGAQRLAFYRELLPFADAGRAAHAEQVMTALAGGDGVVSEGRH
jgi:glycosyltransferase involved in cell wall biosynthesis